MKKTNPYRPGLPRYKIIHCSACEKRLGRKVAIARFDRKKYKGWHVPAEEILAATRRHYKKHHPTLFRRMIKKGVKNRTGR